MKLNWFSPLPPAPTDIAHYTSRILPALSDVAEVTLWTTKRHWAGSLEKFAEVRRYGLNRPPWRELNRADVTFYNLGNNPRFHFSIWHMSGAHPGVVVLHDFSLHHFFDWVYREHYQSRKLYLAVMEKLYGPGSVGDARECFNTNAANINRMSSRYPLTQLALLNTLGVLVHTQQNLEALKPTLICPLAYAPLPFPAPAEVPARPIGPPYRLIVFGYLGKNRRIDSILEALAQLPEKALFRLDIFGSILENESSIHQRIRSLRLSELVKVHGFVPERRLEEALATSHLAINLRFPTVGEASGSQLRIWSHALPSLVSQVGWYRSLPAGAVGFVRYDENEVGDIQNHLLDLLQEPLKFTEMGLRGLAELSNTHSPKAYARRVIEIAEMAMQFRRQSAAQSLATRASIPLKQWLPSTEVEDVLKHVVEKAVSLVDR